MKGRGVVCKEHNKPFVIEEYEVPGLEPGSILLRMVQSGICGSDLHVYEGRTAAEPGIVFGHENMGIIREVGPGRLLDFFG